MERSLRKRNQSRFNRTGTFPANRDPDSPVSRNLEPPTRQVHPLPHNQEEGVLGCP
jgi:hypothetical protein